MSKYNMKNTSEEKDQKYAAFLRGINVGGHTLVKMEELRRAFESLGFRSVKTVLASGNVLFEAPQENTATLSGNIKAKLYERFGREIAVIVRPIDDLRKLEARQPFKGVKVTPRTRLFVTFLSDAKECRDISGPSMRDGFRILSISDGMICSILDEQPGVGAVHLMGAIEKDFGPGVTTRTWNTITRILTISDTG
jgi:uncharacterized protein (DUF1697 family)